MYPDDLSGHRNHNNYNGGLRRGEPNAVRPPPPYSRPPPYARPPPPYSRPTSEELLFDDIFREKAISLRSVMTDFLLVQPFYKFDTEFQTFVSRIKRLTAEGQRAVAAAAAVRDANAAAAAAAAFNNVTIDATCSAVTVAKTASRPPPPPYVFGLRCSNDYGQHPSVDQPGTSASAGPSAYRVSLAERHLDGDAANNGHGSSATRPKPTQSGSAMPEKREKYLSKWSVQVMTLDLVCPVAVLKLNGTLLAEDQVTVLEETHDAGMIEGRKSINVVKTTHGHYNLSGPITNGFSNDFYNACLENNGFPKNWRNFLIQFSSVEESNEDTADTSVTRNGTNYRNGAQRSNFDKGKLLSKQNLAKQKVVMQQLSQASASKTLEQLSVCKTPTQFLKYQFHRKLVKACKIVTNQFK